MGHDTDIYEISTNTTYHINTTMTTHKIEGHYNIPLEINITAMNCAGISSAVALSVLEGTCPSTVFSVHRIVGVALSER